ncbi:uncharacterized protein [Epargyreus clarus]|uniref:uncharacterized protein n=1 Tax=Epargyreus clarus TaxID=520877 RepID=UPI003C2AEBEC
MNFRDVDFSDPKVMKVVPYRRRRCPVVVTLADTQITPVDIQKMLEAGMNAAKFKMSYSTTGDRIRLLGKVDKAALACCKKHGLIDWPVATCIELKTCIVKTGMLESDNEYIILKEGTEVILTCSVHDFNKCNERKIFVDNHYVSKDVKVGTEVSIESEEIILKCIEVIDDKRVKCVVTKSGKLTNLCNVCSRSETHARPYITKKDLEIVKFALEYQVDIIIINYVRHVEPLKKIKQYIGKKIKRPLLISGICTQKGLDNFDDIIKESDGIIMSREYLSYELDPSKRYRMSRIQKWMGAKCQQAGKPFFISGVFQNALKNGIFDDTEISDVTYAILDGASGFILKDCYEIDYLLAVLNAMKLLCYSVEPLVTSKIGFWRIVEETKMPLNAAEAAVMSCAAVANVTNATLVVIPTVTGKTIKALHLMRLSCIIITLSSNNLVTRLLHTYRGVYPLMYVGATHKQWHATVEANVNYAIEFAVKKGWANYGDAYVTLYRDSENSSFCDSVSVFKVTVAKKSLVDNELRRFLTYVWCIARTCLLSFFYFYFLSRKLYFNIFFNYIMVWPTSYDVKLGEYDAMQLPGQQLPSSHAHSPLDHLLNLDINAPPACQRLTGIIAAIGSSTNDIEVMEQMMAAGMNVALLNLSFGSREEHIETIKMLRQAAKNYSIIVGRNYPLAIAASLGGRKIRTGKIADSYGETVELKTGEVVRLTTDETYRDRCSTYTVYIDFMYFADQMKKGDVVLLDNEKIALKIEMISVTTMTCKIERGGFLGSHKDVFVPNVTLDMPNFTEKDKLDIEMAKHQQLDIIIAPFANSADAVTELRQLMGDKGKKIAIVANIQTIEGFRNFDEILTVANGIMITRQELGSDISPEKLVIAQKNMIARANMANIPVSVNAHLLSSMRSKKIPLRAEVLDIANCIIDGADALVLSAETAVGLYPVETVACLASACKEAEACIWSKQIFNDFTDKTPIPCEQATATAIAAVLAAQRTMAAAIIVITTSGKSAHTVSKYKPRCPVIGVTRYPPIGRQMHLWRGIMPVIYEG